jgi:hypothetical protein
MKGPVGGSPVTWELAETGNIKRAIRASSKLRNRCWVANYSNSYVEALILGTPTRAENPSCHGMECQKSRILPLDTESRPCSTIETLKNRRQSLQKR